MALTQIDPVEAAESVGMSVYDFDNLVRDNAAMRLKNLADRILRGNEANEGDVEYDHYHEVVAEVWRQVEAAKVLTAAWLQEEADA
jgi:hypothetical protein